MSEDIVVRHVTRLGTHIFDLQHLDQSRSCHTAVFPTAGSFIPLQLEY